MSTLKPQLQEDIKTAMRAKDQHTLVTLRGLSAAIKQVEVDTREELNDEKIISIIQKEVKKRRDTISFAEQQSRQEIVDQNKQEIALLQKYLGEQLSEEQLKTIIEGAVAAGADNLGKIMGALNKDHKGKFDGKVASELAKACLGQ